MSNSPTNREQSQLLVQPPPTQLNPGAAKPSDFIIQARDGDQHGDSKAERAALLAEADNDAKSNLREPVPDRNEVNSTNQESFHHFHRTRHDALQYDPRLKHCSVTFPLPVAPARVREPLAASPGCYKPPDRSRQLSSILPAVHRQIC
jgi:hypothetical protein